MRGNAVPTMAWSSAASSSASITPMVARTLIRVVSSACGMGFSLLDAHRVDEAETQMSQLNQLRTGQTLGERDLSSDSLAPQRLDPLAALIAQLGIDRAPVGGIIDALDEAIALQVVDQAGHRSRGDVQHLGQLPHREAPVRLVFQAHQDLEAALAEAEPLRPSLHAHVELLAKDANGRERLGSRLDGSALSRQKLANSRVEQETVRVRLELGLVVIGLESELTHIYRAHYYIAQETGQPVIGGNPVTGRGRRPAAPSYPFTRRAPLPGRPAPQPPA